MFSLNGKKFIFKGKKNLPTGTIIILTSNNAEELRALLHHITDNTIFISGKCKVIVIDNYSFDKTIEIALEYQALYPNQISLKNKLPHQSHLDTILKYTSNEYIEIINLIKINELESHLPPDKFPKWLEKILHVITFKKRNNFIERRILIERLEKNQQFIYNTLRKEILEPLTNVQMQVKHDYPSQESIEILDKMISKLQHILYSYNPTLFINSDLLESITVAAEHFTNRTQITCSIKETGKAVKIDYYLGISMMKILTEALVLFEKHGHSTIVNIRLRWHSNKLFLRLSDNSKTVNIHSLSIERLGFIEERSTLLGGKYKFKRTRGIELYAEIPLKKNGE